MEVGIKGIARDTLHASLPSSVWTTAFYEGRNILRHSHVLLTVFPVLHHFYQPRILLEINEIRESSVLS